MNKKKVKELIEQITDTVNWHITAATESDYKAKIEVLRQLEEVKSEIQKSDWVSVEDGLPKYLEDVDVRIDDLGVIKYEVSHRSKRHPYFRNEPIDENEFRVLNPADEKITHWKPIEKLEE